jgi:hypothetical protein
MRANIVCPARPPPSGPQTRRAIPGIEGRKENVSEEAFRIVICDVNETSRADDQSPRSDPLHGLTGLFCLPPVSSSASLTTLQPFENLLVNTMDDRGEVCVFRLGSAVADDEIAIRSVADRCLLSEVKQISHFNGVRTAIDPFATLSAPAQLIAGGAGARTSSLN